MVSQAISRLVFAQGSASEQPAPIDQAAFRRVLGNFASGVTVVTVEHDGQYHGSTVASFCSVSLAPPLVLVCIDRRATTHRLLEQTGTFAVSILGEDGADMSRHFASRHPDKFASVAYHQGLTGAPLLDDAIATLECRVVSQFPGGDHSIFVGEVLVANALADLPPLIYFHSGYGALK